MWFLIKGTFWFTMMLVALSFFSSRPAAVDEAGAKLEVADAVHAATGVYQYLSGLCLERPEVCEKGAETLTALGHRAREGALVAFDILDNQLSGEATTKTAAGAATVPETLVTGTVAPGVGAVANPAAGAPAVPLPRAKPAQP